MKSTRFAALFALWGIVQTYSEDLIEGSHTADHDKRLSLSPYSEACKEPVVLETGFRVIYRLCGDTNTHYDQNSDGDEDGANPGPPPEEYSFGEGCEYAYEDSGLYGAMSPKFVTDLVYSGKNAYRYPKAITEPNFWRETEWPTTGNIYGKRMQTAGFSLELEGYFLPPQTGSYTFSLKADDGASLQIGQGITCCWNVRSEDIKRSQIVALTSGGEDPVDLGKIKSVRTAKYTVHLEKGVYYPMRVVYFSAYRSFILDLRVVQPDGMETSDWSDVKILDTSDLCYKIRSTSSSSSFTPTTSTMPTSKPSPDAAMTTSTSDKVPAAVPSPNYQNCLAPVALSTGFKVTHRICPDTSQRFSETDGGIEDGANPGPPPKGYSVSGGCNGALDGLSSDGAMSYAFVTDLIYSGKDAYRYPEGITEPNFWRETQWATTGNLYGKRVQTVGFSLEFEGYFLAPQTGSYTFSLEADDGASLQIGKPVMCCQEFTQGDGQRSELVSYTSSTDPRTATSKVSIHMSHYTVELTKGFYYPMRVVYFNSQGSFVFNIDITRPDGTTTSDWSDIKQIDWNCPVIESVLSTSTLTSDTGS